MPTRLPETSIRTDVRNVGVKRSPHGVDIAVMEPDEPSDRLDDVARDWIERSRLETTADRVRYLRSLAAELHESEEPDPEQCLDLGVGPLESLLFEHEKELWPELEQLAREDVRFRRAYASVWAYDSPMFDRREALLDELGESPRMSVSFVGTPEDFSDPPLLGWRAVEIEGAVDDQQLARLLRDIADWADRRGEGLQGRAVRQRHLWEHWYAWSNARDALERAAHALAIEDDPDRLSDHVRRIDEARQIEAARWHALRTYL